MRSFGMSMIDNIYLFSHCRAKLHSRRESAIETPSRAFRYEYPRGGRGGGGEGGRIARASDDFVDSLIKTTVTACRRRGRKSVGAIKCRDASARNNRSSRAYTKPPVINYSANGNLRAAANI